MDYGAHLPIIDFRAGSHTRPRLQKYAVAARYLGFRYLAANDHLIFTLPRRPHRARRRPLRVRKHDRRDDRRSAGRPQADRVREGRLWTTCPVAVVFLIAHSLVRGMVL